MAKLINIYRYLLCNLHTLATKVTMGFQPGDIIDGTTQDATLLSIYSWSHSNFLLPNSVMAIISCGTYSDVLWYALYRCVIYKHQLLLLRRECCEVVGWRLPCCWHYLFPSPSSAVMPEPHLLDQSDLFMFFVLTSSGSAFFRINKNLRS